MQVGVFVSGNEWSEIGHSGRMSSSLIEVAVDPKRVHPTRPHIHIAEMPSLSVALFPGQTIRVRSQGEAPATGVARVWEINRMHRLIYLTIDWDG